MSGAFGDLAEIIKKRLQRQGIGFEADVRSSEIPWEILKEVSAQDLIEFGFESEFVGRLPVVVVFDELTKEDLVEILKNPNNPIILSKRQDFRSYDIDIKFEDKALEKIAELAAAEKTGARGLVSAMERVLIPFEKKLPSTDIKRLLITREVVENPDDELKAIQKDPENRKRLSRFEKQEKREAGDIKAFIASRANDLRETFGLDLYEKRFELVAEIYLKKTSDINTALEDFTEMHQRIKEEEAELYGKLDIQISFDESAIDELIRESIDTDQDAGTLAFQLAKKLEYGLKLVRDRSGESEFTITAAAVTNMEQYINGLVKTLYRGDLEFAETEDREGD
jgi:ATP-dependent protease HslVU (ClpYQ) ATPase subunit